MNDTEKLTRTAIASWKQTIARLDEALAKLSDADLERRVAPDRNRVVYLVGHLTAVHDRMLPLLMLGDRMHPELDEPFLTEADSHTPYTLSATELRRMWTEVNTKLTSAIDALPADKWLDRHASVSAEDFAREPLRNRLSVLLSRTSHAAFHQGQIRLAY